jgi:hypothetical protein
MRVSVLMFLMFFFHACGVDSSSSSTIVPQSSEGTNSATTTVDINTSDTNTSDTNTSDTNTTTDTNSTTTTIVIDDSTVSGFSKTDAEEDTNACSISGSYHFIEDSSFDPNAVADAINGVDITSQYSYSANLEATKVVLYYPSLSVTLLDEKIHVYEDNYMFSFDKAWSSNALSKVYVRTPKDIYGAYSCYRYDLSSVSGTTIQKTKVYR